MQLSLIPRLLLLSYAFIFVSTEILSVLNILSRGPVLICDIAFFSLLVYFHRSEIKTLVFSIKLKSKLLYALVSLLALTFIQGLFSAPSTTDSMVYHIPRIMYWMQYKTLFQDVIRGSHDFMAPFGEYLLLHLYFITNSDRLLFISQWLAYLSIIALTVCITKKFITQKIRSVYVAILAASLPIAVLQSSSTQTDLVTCLMVLLSLYYAFEFKKSPGYKQALALGVSLGLGALTKATFVVYAVIPLGIIVLALLEQRKHLLKTIIPLLLAAVLALLMQSRFLSQNLQLYGNFSGQPILEEGSGYTNELVSLPVLVSNLIRNSFLNLPVPILNHQVGQFISQFHNLIGIDINNPQTTYSGTFFEVKSIIFPQEDIVASPIHFLLIVATGIYLLINRRYLKHTHKNLLSIFGLSLLSFFIFSLLLKWQPFHPRLLIPFLLLGSLSSFITLMDSKKLKPVLNGLLITSLILAFILSILNVSRPYVSYKLFYNHINQFSQPNASIPESFYIKPREEQYFNSRAYWHKPYTEIVSQLESSPGVKDI